MMDFSSIMAAARNNSVQAKQQKESMVFKTKLAAPKKAEKKKVDVEALRRRKEEEERRAKELASKPKLAVKPQIDKSKTNAAAKVNTKASEKSKYESKEHEQKHKQFMNKLQSSASKKEVKKISMRPPTNSGKDSKGQKPISAKKIKPAVAPSFTDLIKMAEKVATDPNSVVDLKPKLNIDKVKETDSKSHKKLSKESGTSSTGGKTDKNKPTNGMSGKQKQTNGGGGKSKHLGESSSSSNKQQLDKRKCEATPASKEKKPVKVTPKQGTQAKRPGGGSNAGPVAKKPMLSDAAMAKLAFKEGRRPQPRPNVPNPVHRSSTVASKSVPKSKSSEISAKDKDSAKKEGKAENNAPTVSAWDRLMGTNSANNKDRKKKASHRFIDSEDEDEDLEGFIDDGDDDIDYSSAIRDIFGYDKSRYKDEDFDDRSMVAGYADIMKEEVRSAKLGLKEDLEDMELEERERQKKLQRKKR